MLGPQDQKMKSKAQRGPVVKQFEWFEMQTRVRKIIQDLMSPVQYQIVKNTSQIQKLQKSNVSFNDQIHYMLRMTTNDPQVFEKGVFKRIQNRFDTQQKTLTFLEQQVKNNTTFIDNKISLIDERMKQSNDMISQVQQLKASNRQNLKLQTEKFQKIMKNIEQNVQKISGAIDQNQKNGIQKMEKLEKKLSQHEMKMESMSKEFTQVKEYFQSQKAINEDFINQRIKLQEQNRLLQVKISQLNKKLKDLSKIKPFLQDVQVDFQKLLFKVDNILPLVNEAQINESLYRVLPQKFHPRIAVYQFQRYNELNLRVLSRKFQLDPTGINFNGQQTIRQSQQRNTKLLTKLKLNYYKKNGIDLDFITFEERERLLVTDFDYGKLCEIIDELQEMENEKNDRKKNHKLTEEDVINLVNKQMQDEKILLLGKIQTEIADSKTYLHCCSQMVQNTIQKLENKIEKLSQNLKNQKVTHELLIKSFEQHEVEANQKFIRHTEKFDILHIFSKEVSSYLEENFQNMKKLTRLSQIPEYDAKVAAVRIQNKNLNPKISSKKHSPSKNRMGAMIVSDSDENGNASKIIHEKQHDSSPEVYNFEEQGQKMIQKIRRSIIQYLTLDEKDKLQGPMKFKGSFSKLTRGSDNQLKYKSHSSFDPLRKNSTNLSELNRSNQLHKSSQKNEGNGFLNIPELRNVSGTKYCKQSYTSRLGMRKNPLMNPPRATFFQSQEQGQGIKNREVQDSLVYFSELRKQNSRYLK